MIRIEYVAQPAHRTTLDAIDDLAKGGDVKSIDIAAAYITSGGVDDLIGRISKTLGKTWPSIPKRWITSFDYCRTEPVALNALRKTPSSEVRIYDAGFCLIKGGVPRVPFHPKIYLVRSNTSDSVLAGSGNLSRSGLSKGVEAGLVVTVSRTAGEPTATETMRTLRKWFSTTWGNATTLDKPLLDRYTKLVESVPNLKAPAPTEDDLASSDTGRGSLSDRDLLKLRVCRHFWIESGNITKNRGPNLPGNQLMMKRLSRVFFGFEPSAVPENTFIGNVDLIFNGSTTGPYSLTYSDNKMDKLILPIPGTDGPPAYDNEFLLFTRTAPRTFNLKLGAASDKTAWAKRSRAVDSAFKMASGREWGVF